MPTAPLPPFIFIVGAITLPADWVMVPVPVAVSVTEVLPVAFAPRDRLPLVAVDCRIKLVVEETMPEFETSALDDNVRAPAVAVSPDVERVPPLLLIVPDPIVPDTASAPPVLVRVVAPVSLRTIVLA